MSKITMFILRHWKTPKEESKASAPVKLTCGKGRQIIRKQSKNILYDGDKDGQNNSWERLASQAYKPMQARNTHAHNCLTLGNYNVLCHWFGIQNLLNKQSLTGQ